MERSPLLIIPSEKSVSLEIFSGDKGVGIRVRQGHKEIAGVIPADLANQMAAALRSAAQKSIRERVLKSGDFVGKL